MERDRLLERLANARATLAKKSKAWGRPLRGHSKKDRARGVKPLDVARIRALKAAGKSDRQIAMATHVPRSTVRDALARAD